MKCMKNILNHLWISSLTQKQVPTCPPALNLCVWNALLSLMAQCAVCLTNVFVWVEELSEMLITGLWGWHRGTSGGHSQWPLNRSTQTLEKLPQARLFVGAAIFTPHAIGQAAGKRPDCQTSQTASCSLAVSHRGVDYSGWINKAVLLYWCWFTAGCIDFCSAFVAVLSCCSCSNSLSTHSRVKNE